jgi:Leucine-rich repeat (LRR) protein
MIPPEIGLSKNLEEITLKSNPISDIPSEINKLKHLRFMDLSNTLIKKDNVNKIQNYVPWAIISFPF